jgi:hypothetical protein
MYVPEEEIKRSTIREEMWPTVRDACANPFAWKMSVKEVQDFSAMILYLDGKECHCVLLLLLRRA